MPRVSVIIPAYNAEPYIAETLSSIEAQTYSDWEVVVADDDSKDRTVEIAAAFGGSVKVLRGASNEGPAAARNRAVSASSGELLAFLDADDLWLPTYLERAVALYDDSRAHGVRAGIVASDAHVLGGAGFLERTYMEYMNTPHDVTLSELLVSNTVPPHAVSPRTLVDEVGGFCAQLFGTEDYDLWLRILERDHRLVATRETLAVYRLRPRSVASDLTRMARSMQLTYRRALERGRLTRRQERITRRQLRLQHALEEVGVITSGRTAGGWPLARLARRLPLFLRVGVENPDRWLTAARLLARRGSPLSQLRR